jgi:hypothetical protein
MKELDFGYFGCILQRMPRSAPAAPLAVPNKSKHATVRSVVPPAYAPPPPPPQMQAPTLGQSIKDGFGLGLGSSIASRLVSNIFGPPTITVQTAQRQPTEYEQCLVEHRDDPGVCGHLAQKK